MIAKERVKGHYEVRKSVYANDYVWVPGEQMVEKRLLDDILHPWHADYEEWLEEQRVHPEEQYQMELEAL